MPILLNRMPFSKHPSEVMVRGERVRVRADQIILWVSISLEEFNDPNSSVIPFPVILDTGHTHSFSLHERHLAEWAGLQPDALRILAAVRDRNQRLFLRAANIWIHANERGNREELAKQSPHLVDALQGIAVYPGEDFPRLPIFGLRAIAENDLILKVNGHQREATMRTANKWWPFE